MCMYVCMYVCIYIYTATPRLTTIPRTTNRSYDQNFLKKMSIQTTIKIPLKSHLELHFEFRAQSVDYHNADSVLIILQQEDYLLESLSACWSVCSPPHFVFSTDDQVFRTYSVRKSGSVYITIELGYNVMEGTEYLCHYKRVLF
jgi:hypothetical protein